MLKCFFVIFAFVVLVILAMAGFRGMKSTRPPLEIFPDMDRQPKVKAQMPGAFFADGRAARAPVKGTVPLGYSVPVEGGGTQDVSPYRDMTFSRSPDYANTGKMGENWGTGLPFEMTTLVMHRGQERYRIFCAVCHGASGAGNGISKQFGMATVQSLTQERIRTMSDGEIFHTITHGKNTMLGYGDRIPVADRWAIIAYIRALQRSQGGATIDDVPPAERAKLQSR